MNVTTDAVWNLAEKGLGYVSKQIGNAFQSGWGIYITIALVAFILWRIFRK